MSALKTVVLIVDDEVQIHKFLVPALEAAGYHPISAFCGQDALKDMATRAPAAVFLDLGLPDMDGKTVLEKARCFYDGAILILSARDFEGEKIHGLDLGADDYIEKPFRVGELMARLRVALRHKQTRAAAQTVIRFGDVELDRDLRRVRRLGKVLRLSPKEYELLSLLATEADKVMTHRQLLTHVWGSAHAEDIQYLRVFIGQIMQKIESKPSEPQYLLTEPGVGYRLVVNS